MSVTDPTPERYELVITAEAEVIPGPDPDDTEEEGDEQ